MPSLLTNLDQLPKNEPIYIYGCGSGGRRLYRAVRLVAGLEIAGVVDSFATGSFFGQPILNVQQFRELNHAEITLIIASSHFQPIAVSLADLPLKRCFDSRPILDAFPSSIRNSDDDMDDQSFRALFDWLMRDSAVQRALKGSYSSYLTKLKFDAVDRPNYGFIMTEAARLCHALGQSTVTAIEFGVAGGNGLLSMEQHAEEIEKILPIKFAIFGFDTGAGMPPSTDSRDFLCDLRPGFFPMDQAALRGRLKRAELVIGDIADSLGTFFQDRRHRRLGAAASTSIIIRARWPR